MGGGKHDEHPAGQAEAGEPSAEAVMEALKTVQSLLDRLTAEGRHAAAFEIARAQFSASVRASWPANLSAIATAIDRAIDESAASLPADERQALRVAADVFRRVRHP